MRAISALLLLAAAFAVQSPAVAGVDASAGPGSYDLTNDYREDAAAATRQATNERNAVPVWSYAKIPACPGNDIDTGVIDRCPQALTACDEPDVLQWWLYRAPYRANDPITVGEPGWTRTGTLCSSPDAAGTDPMVPAYSLTEFQRLPLPPGTSNVEPPTGQVYVTVPTNVFATDTDPVLIDTTLAGLPITVRATPARWSWDFGEADPDHGGRPMKGSWLGPTTNPGAPYPNLLNTYAYATRGDHAITMTTHYTGEYSLDGGTTWLPITGEATVASPPVPIHALGGHTVLVDDLVDGRTDP